MKTKPVLQTWILLLGVAVAVAVVGYWGSLRVRATLERTVEGELETTLRANAQALEIWMTNQVRLAVSLADDPPLRIVLTHVAEVTASSGPRWEREQPGSAFDELGKRLQLRLANVGYDGAIVNTNLVVVAACGRGSGRIGRTVLESHGERFAELFTTGQPVLIHPFRPAASARLRSGRASDAGMAGRMGAIWGAGGWRTGAGGGPSEDLLLMQVAVPIRDEAGTILGALTLIIDPEREFTRILSVSRLGDSGESYAFDISGRILSRSRFETQLRQLGLLTNQPAATSVLNLRLSDPGGDVPAVTQPNASASDRPLIRLVTAAVQGGEGVDTRPSRDYRGVPVVGAWRWLPELDFGLVAQQDAAEAYRPLRVLQWLFLFLVLLLLLAALGLLTFSHAHGILRRKLNDAELKARELGQYRLEEKLGEGGMGVVYRARHVLMRRPTAIKLLLPDRASPEAIRQFEREVQLTSALTHPNTIQIYDYGYTPDDVFYYVMEYLEGLTLKELVNRFGPLPESRAIYLLGQICDALHEAHQKGLVHQDIKPANVFLSQRGGIPDSVKVLDFGLVRQYRADAGATSSVEDDHGLVGTPCYMSPESICSPGSADPRSDVYSLGALGYYLVTGHPLFESVSLAELLHRHVSKPPLSPKQRTGNPITPEFEGALLRCLEKNPARRPQSVMELRALLATSPQVDEWNAGERAAWWGRFGDQVHRGSGRAVEVSPQDPMATLRVGLTTRRL